MTNNNVQKGFAMPGIIAIVALIAVVGGISYFSMQKQGDEKEEAMVEKKMMEETAMMKAMKYSFTAQNNSGQTGMVTFSDDGIGKTKVMIDTTGAPKDVPQPAHIHVGPCKSIGAVKYPLMNVVNGKSETILAVSLDNLLKELPFAVNVHKSAAEAKVYVTCADITSGQAMMEKPDGTMVKPEGAAMVKPDGAMMVKPEGAAMVKEDGAMMAKAGTYEAYSPEKIALAAAKGNVVLNFTAAWCPTCRALEANINANLANIPSNLTILKVDYDNSTALKKKYGVTYQHTMVQVDKDGNLIKKWMGSPTLVAFVAEVK